MNFSEKKKGTLKEKVYQEFVDYWINACYLAIVFAAFTIYRRLVLAAYDVTYTNYGVAVIEALILAKVIMIGEVARLGRGLEHMPLIFPTLYKTLIFTLFVVVFTGLEYMLKGLWKGSGVMGGLAELLGKGHHEILANSIIIFVSFFPFFGVKELGRVLGKDKIQTLFLKKRDRLGFESVPKDV
jgi:hypothetical protein